MSYNLHQAERGASGCYRSLITKVGLDGPVVQGFLISINTCFAGDVTSEWVFRNVFCQVRAVQLAFERCSKHKVQHERRRGDICEGKQWGIEASCVGAVDRAKGRRIKRRGEQREKRGMHDVGSWKLGLEVWTSHAAEWGASKVMQRPSGHTRKQWAGDYFGNSIQVNIASE